MIERSSQPAPGAIPPSGPRRARRNSCLIWILATAFCLLVSLVIVAAAAYGGWNAGLQSARARATESAASELQGQCDLLRQNLADGNLDLAKSRIDWLEQRDSAPNCLRELAPMATAAYLLAQPSPTFTAQPAPTDPMPTAQPSPAFTAQPAPTETSDDSSEWAYDLEGLLAEAQADIALGNYPSAISTLEAIVSIDESYQRDLVRAMLLEALTNEALALYRRFKLSEAIVLTERAETYGDIGELNYERYIADTFLIAQSYKTTNPAEATRLFSQIVYQHNRNYMNGQVVGELQDALRYYGDALLLGGEACLAHQQYGAALALQPNRSPVSRSLLIAKQQEAAQACSGNGAVGNGGENISPASTPLPIGVRGG